MGAEQFGELLEGGEPTAAGTPEPLPQVAGRPHRAPVLPEPPEVLLEEVALHDGAVEAQEPGELGPFRPHEVLRIRQPEEASPFELDPLAPLQLPPGRSPDVIDGVIAVLREVEAVEHHCGLGDRGPDGRQVGSPHVAADHLDGPRPPLAQPRRRTAARSPRRDSSPPRPPGPARGHRRA